MRVFSALAAREVHNRRLGVHVRHVAQEESIALRNTPQHDLPKALERELVQVAKYLLEQRAVPCVTSTHHYPTMF